ncbi:MAG: glucan biosynthesis protein D, partial [Variovorax sp.]
MQRRDFLSAAGLAGLGLSTGAMAALRLGAPTPFSFDALRARARALAAQPHVAAPTPAPDVVQRIDYDAHGKLRFDAAEALFASGPGAFPVTFFHLGRFFPAPVRMHRIERTAGDAFARELRYDPASFSMPADSPARQLPEGAGFAGFRIQESRFGGAGQPDWRTNDWVAFLGASYFRAIGELYQYGLSARGIAIDVAVPGRPEEFPAFTNFWFEPSPADRSVMTVYALLEGPSVTGAYRFTMRRGKAVVMDIDSTL